jgi:hypothetical protein
MRAMWRKVLAGGLGVVGCGSEEEPESAYFGTTGYVRDCRFATDSVALSEATRLGVSAADVLGWVEGERRMPVKYNPDGYERLEIEPHTSELTLGLESLGRASWIDRYAKPPSNRDVYCDDTLLLDTHLRLSTADGILSHEMDVTLVLKSPDLARADVRIPTTALRSGFREYAMPPEGVSAKPRLALILELTPSGSSGVIVTYDTPFPPQTVTAAAFPGTMVCNVFERPMVEAEYASFRPQVVAALNASSPVALPSRGASLDLSFEDHAEQGCVMVGEAGEVSIRFMGAAVLRSSDGAIDGRIEVSIGAAIDGSASFIASAERTRELADAEEAAAQAARVITEPLDFSRDGIYELEFLHRVTSEGENTEGRMIVTAPVARECAVDAPPASCDVSNELFAARWGTVGSAP